MSNAAEKKTDLSEFFSLISQEKTEQKEKIKEQISNPTSDLSSLFKQLEDAHKEIKKEKTLSEEDQIKLESFSNLVNILNSESTNEKDIQTEPDITRNEFPKDEIQEPDSDIGPEEQSPTLEEIESVEEETEEPVQEVNDIIKNVVTSIGDMSDKLEVKEQVDEVTALRREFNNFKKLIQKDIANQKMSGAGSGEVRLEFLDDVQRSTAKVDGKFLKYDSSSDKFVGADASSGAAAADDISAGDAAVNITTTSGNITIDAAANNSDIIFKGTDGGSDTTFLTIDGSAAGAATFNDKIVATELDISGDVDVDGTLEADAITVNGTTLTETVQDIVGAMVSSNTESGITVAYQDADGTLDFTVGTLNQDTTGSAATLTTARTIGGVSFDGSANINLPGVNTAGNQNTTGSAATLTTARTIGGVSFDGSANINLPGVNTSGSQDTSGNAATATALETARTIHGVSFDGSANIDLSEVVQDTVGAMFSSNTETGVTVTYQDSDGTIDLVIGTLNQDTTGNAATATALETARTIHGVSFDGSANIDLSEVIQDTVGAMFGSNTETDITVTYQDADGTIDLVVSDISGNAATATTLANARTIGGVSFNGSANINLPGVNTSGDQDTSGNAATATALATGRTINGTSFDGTANITVTAAAGTLTGNTLNSDITASSLTTVGTLSTLTVDNVIINGTTIGHTDDTDLITLADGVVTVAGNLTVSGTTTTVNQTVVNVTDAFIFEGANADAHETTFRVNEPTADRKASLQDKTGTIELVSGFTLNGTDGSSSNAGDFIVLNTSADDGDRLLYEDATSDPIAVFASHGITLSGVGWNALQFDNDYA